MLINFIVEKIDCGTPINYDTMDNSFSSSPWHSYTISSTSSYSPQPSFTPTYTNKPSHTAQMSFTPTYTAEPLPSNSPLAQMQPQTRNFLANLSNDALYGIIAGIIIVIVYSIHNTMYYYTAYKNEKMRKRIADNVTVNPYYGNLQDNISRV